MANAFLPVLALRAVFLFLLVAGSLAAKAQTTAVATKFEHGTLTQGQPTGAWEYFEEGNQLALRMNYDSSRISYRRPDTARYELLINDEWRLVQPSRPPILLGSRAQRRATVSKELRYPVAAVQQQLQGDVLLSYLVQPNGQASDFTVLSSPSSDCTQEVWRVLNQQSDRWIPAVYLGQPRVARFYLRVRFEMVRAPTIAAGRAAQSPPPSSGPFTDAISVIVVGIERSSPPRQR